MNTSIVLIITLRVLLVGLDVLHSVARVARDGAQVTVGLAIGNSERAVLPVERGEHETNGELVVVVLGAVGVLEQLDLEVAVLLLRIATVIVGGLDQNAACEKMGEG